MFFPTETYGRTDTETSADPAYARICPNKIAQLSAEYNEKVKMHCASRPVHDKRLRYLSFSHFAHMPQKGVYDRSRRIMTQ